MKYADTLVNHFFNNKSIMLRSSADKFETIFFARYLLLFGGYENRIYVEDIHKLKTLLEAVAPEVTFVSPDQLTDVVYDVEYSMQKLRWLSKDSFLSSKSFVYLQPQYLPNDKFDNLESNTATEKTGLALFDRNGKTVVDVLDFYNDLPRHKLRHKSFYPITVQNSSDSITLFGLHSNRASEFTSDYRDITAFISRLDYLISFDNIIAHIAGAMGKKVWLLVANDSESIVRATIFKNRYPDITIFQQKNNENWNNAFLRLSLNSLLSPLNNSLLLSDDEIAIEKDIRHIHSAANRKEPDDILDLLYAPTPPFVNVIIETTTVCNLNCSYCPNSTIGRPDEFMDESIFYKIIDSVADYNSMYGYRITPHFYGEPLLDNRLEYLIAYSKNKLPLSNIELFTNGLLLTVERYLSLKAAGVGRFVISQHSKEPSPVVVNTMKTISREYPELYSVAYFDLFHSKSKMNRGGLINNDMPEITLLRCNLFKELIFDVHGNSVLCCNDYLSSISFGSIINKSIGEIWENPEYIKTRNLLSYSYFPYLICKKCSFLG